MYLSKTIRKRILKLKFILVIFIITVVYASLVLVVKSRVLFQGNKFQFNTHILLKIFFHETASKSDVSSSIQTNLELDLNVNLHSVPESTTYRLPVTSPMCNISILNEWDPKIKPLFEKREPVYENCTKNEPLSYVYDNRILIINQRINKTVFNGSIKWCEMAPVVRSTIYNDSFILGQFKRITRKTILIDDYVKVRCFMKYLDLNSTETNATTKFKIVYEYVHSAMLSKRINYDYVNNKASSNYLNVMILVIDGVSLSSMKRALPETLKFLKTYDNYFLFEKHHVTGENTFQNLVPMLTNLNSQILLDKNNTIFADQIFDNETYSNDNLTEIPWPFDKVPFVWKNFRKSGYTTYFSEEWKESTFNNLKFGFRQQPTDHYLRPFWLSLYDSLSYEPTVLNSNPKPCYYNKLLHKISFEWLENLEKFYSKKEKDLKNDAKIIPRFGIVKINEMSHDYLERLFWIDNDLKSLLMGLFNIDNYLDNTLFILMGDHGHRFHKIRETFVGKMEEKLPMFSMMVPRKLLKRNKFLRDNLVRNTKSLTTFWDVHETLVHLLMDQNSMSPVNSNYLKHTLKYRKDYNKPNGRSLFYPIPERDCQKANIPEYLCACSISLNVDLKNDVIKRGTSFLIEYINNQLLGNFKLKCFKLRLNKIIDAQMIMNSESKYSVIFETSPGNAKFDASFKHNKKFNHQTNATSSGSANNEFKLIGKIIRINEYGLTSNCVKIYDLKNFCYCYDYHKKLRSSIKKQLKNV